MTQSVFSPEPLHTDLPAPLLLQDRRLFSNLPGSDQLWGRFIGPNEVKWHSFRLQDTLRRKQSAGLGARLGQGGESDYHAVNTLYCLLVQQSLTGYYRKNLHYLICISNPGLSREDQTAGVPEKKGDTWTARTGKINQQLREKKLLFPDNTRNTFPPAVFTESTATKAIIRGSLESLNSINI